jgi:hypothetical protein
MLKQEGEETNNTSGWSRTSRQALDGELADTEGVERMVFAPSARSAAGIKGD